MKIQCPHCESIQYQGVTAPMSSLSHNGVEQQFFCIDCGEHFVVHYMEYKVTKTSKRFPGGAK